MGGIGSGSWYRIGKKTTTSECHSVDVRYLHRNGLLKPGGWYSFCWSRAGREMGSIWGVVSGDGRQQVTLLYRYRRGLGGEWEDVRETVPLSPGRRATSEERGRGSSVPERTAAGGLRSFTGRADTFCAAPATISPIGADETIRCTELYTEPRRSRGQLGGSANMMVAFPGEAKGHALE